jgi:hypothetical protein
MKPKKTEAPKKKLRLSTETIRSLNSRDLAKVAGGGRKAGASIDTTCETCFCSAGCY